MIKTVAPFGMQWLYRSIRNVWDEHKIPNVWRKGLILVVSICIKGRYEKCENYRGITLLRQPYKIYERILNNELNLETKIKLKEEQYAFREEKATLDFIFSIG